MWVLPAAGSGNRETDVIDTSQVGGRRRPRHRRRTAVIAVCVLAAGIGIYFGTRSDQSPGPAVMGLSTAWTAHSPGVRCEDFGSGNTWVADGNVATCLGNTITAFRLSTGHVQWTWRPAPRAHLDASIGSMSRDVDQGIGVVAYSYATIPKSGSDGPVTTASDISGINLATGRVLWTESTPLSDDLESPGVVVGDGVAAMVVDDTTKETADTRGALTSWSLSVLDISTGAAAWPKAANTGASVPAACHPMSVAVAGDRFYEAARCPQAQGADRLYELSPQTGAVQAASALDDNACLSGGLLSLTALWAVPGYVLGGCNDLASQQAMLIIPTGTVKQRALGYASATDPLDYFRDGPWDPDFAEYGGMLYATTLSAPPGAVSVTAFNLAKGTIAWSRNDVPTIPGYAYESQFTILGADSRGVTVLDTGSTTQQDSEAASVLVLSEDKGNATFGPGIHADDIDASNSEFGYYLTGQLLLALPAGEYNTAPVTAYHVS